MQSAHVWPAPHDLRGLVDLGYALRVGASTAAVVPDARAGVVWLSDGTVRVCGPESRPWRAGRYGVDVVGVRLSLGAVPAVLGTSALGLVDRQVHLQDVWGEPAIRLAERMTDAAGSADRLLVLLETIRSRRAATPEVDPLVRVLTRRLALMAVPVRVLAAEVGLSERQLRRRCATAFGYPPSVLGRLLRLLRLQRFLRSASAATPARPGLAALAAAAGYADQAHLARETRTLTGHAPSAFLAAPTHRNARVADPFKTGQGCGF